MSADKENEYFSDGLAEEILNLLAKIPGLKVIARTSAFAFKGKEQDIRKIAETLNVGTILEGSVRRAGNRIRVTAQLIEAENGSHLWSERYDRDMTDVFAIQDEIAEAISGALKVRLAPHAHAVNVEAYQNYLKGEYHRVRLTPESLAKAKECYDQTLAIDPNYAPAYSGLALYYYMQGVFGIKPASEMAPLARSAAEKALAIDPADSDAHAALASMAALFDYNWKAAEEHYRQGFAVEPVPPRLRFSYAVHYLLQWGRVPEALEQCRLGLETDPLSMLIHWGMVRSMHAAKQFREAIECARKALEIDPNFHQVWIVMGFAQLQAGLPQEAITSFKGCYGVGTLETIRVPGQWPQPTIRLAIASAARNGHGSSPTRTVTISGRRCITPPPENWMRCSKRSKGPAGSTIITLSKFNTCRSSTLTAPTRATKPCSRE